MSPALHGRLFGPALALAVAVMVGGWSPEASAAPGGDYDSSDGTTDPRRRALPRQHRFRFAIDGGHIRLSTVLSQSTGETVRFQWAPLLADFSYQLQFARYMFLRPGFAVGLNVANSRFAMPAVFSPRLFTGVQGRHLGLGVGYVYYAVGYPGLTVANGADGRPNSLGGPRIRRNHGVMGELNFSSRVDGVSIFFGVRVGGVRTILEHYDISGEKSWRLHWGLSAGFLFDGTLRRRREAREAEAAQGGF